MIKKHRSETFRYGAFLYSGFFGRQPLYPVQAARRPDISSITLLLIREVTGLYILNIAADRIFHHSGQIGIPT